VEYSRAVALVLNAMTKRVAPAGIGYSAQGGDVEGWEIGEEAEPVTNTSPAGSTATP